MRTVQIDDLKAKQIPAKESELDAVKYDAEQCMQNIRSLPVSYEQKVRAPHGIFRPPAQNPEAICGDENPDAMGFGH